MIKNIIDHFEELLGSVVLAVMVTIAFANVITRYFIYYPLAFTEEVTINMFVWLVMLGTAVAFRKNAHLCMSFFYNLLPQTGRRLCFYVSAAVTVAFFSTLGWLGYVQVRDEMMLGVTTESLAIPAWIYSIALPVFSVLILIRFIQFFIEFNKKGEF